MEEKQLAELCDKITAATLEILEPVTCIDEIAKEHISTCMRDNMREAIKRVLLIDLLTEG